MIRRVIQFTVALILMPLLLAAFFILDIIMLFIPRERR